MRGVDLTLDGDSGGTCEGDSGGPVFARAASAIDPRYDDSWRLVGVVSAGVMANCGPEAGFAVEITRYLSWIEAETQLDVAPCFHPPTEWNPAPLCGDFAVDRQDGDRLLHGSAGSGSLSATCGAPFAPAPPDQPDWTAQLLPSDSTAYRLDDPESEVPIDVRIEFGDPAPSIQRVSVTIVSADGTVAAREVKEIAPYEFSNWSLGRGSWRIEAVVTDYAGTARSFVSTVSVDEPAASGGETAASGGDGGCNVGRRTSPSRTRVFFGLLFFAGWVRRHRAGASFDRIVAGEQGTECARRMSASAGKDGLS